MAELGTFTIVGMRIRTESGYEFDMPILTDDFDQEKVGTPAYINLSVDLHEIVRNLERNYPQPPKLTDPDQAQDWLDRHPAAT